MSTLLLAISYYFSPCKAGGCLWYNQNKRVANATPSLCLLATIQLPKRTNHLILLSLGASAHTGVAIRTLCHLERSAAESKDPHRRTPQTPFFCVSFRPKAELERRNPHFCSSRGILRCVAPQNDKKGKRADVVIGPYSRNDKGKADSHGHKCPRNDREGAIHRKRQASKMMPALVLI